MNHWAVLLLLLAARRANKIDCFCNSRDYGGSLQYKIFEAKSDVLPKAGIVNAVRTQVDQLILRYNNFVDLLNPLNKKNGVPIILPKIRDEGWRWQGSRKLVGQIKIGVTPVYATSSFEQKTMRFEDWTEEASDRNFLLPQLDKEITKINKYRKKRTEDEMNSVATQLKAELEKLVASKKKKKAKPADRPRLYFTYTFSFGSHRKFNVYLSKEPEYENRPYIKRGLSHFYGNQLEFDTCINFAIGVNKYLREHYPQLSTQSKIFTAFNELLVGEDGACVLPPLKDIIFEAKDYMTPDIIKQNIAFREQLDVERALAQKKEDRIQARIKKIRQRSARREAAKIGEHNRFTHTSKYIHDIFAPRRKPGPVVAKSDVVGPGLNTMVKKGVGTSQKTMIGERVQTSKKTEIVQKFDSSRSIDTVDTVGSTTKVNVGVKQPVTNPVGNQPPGNQAKTMDRQSTGLSKTAGSSQIKTVQIDLSKQTAGTVKTGEKSQSTIEQDQTVKLEKQEVTQNRLDQPTRDSEEVELDMNRNKGGTGMREEIDQPKKRVEVEQDEDEEADDPEEDAGTDTSGLQGGPVVNLDDPAQKKYVEQYGITDLTPEEQADVMRMILSPTKQQLEVAKDLKDTKEAMAENDNTSVEKLETKFEQEKNQVVTFNYAEELAQAKADGLFAQINSKRTVVGEVRVAWATSSTATVDFKTELITLRGSQTSAGTQMLELLIEEMQKSGKATFATTKEATEAKDAAAKQFTELAIIYARKFRAAGYLLDLAFHELYNTDQNNYRCDLKVFDDLSFVAVKDGKDISERVFKALMEVYQYKIKVLESIRWSVPGKRIQTHVRVYEETGQEPQVIVYFERPVTMSDEYFERVYQRSAEIGVAEHIANTKKQITGLINYSYEDRTFNPAEDKTLQKLQTKTTKGVGELI